MIYLTENLYIQADKNQYVLGEPRQTARNGTPCVKMENPSFYTTIGAAVQGAVRRAMREGVVNNTITTLQDFIATQQRTIEEFEKLIAPLEVSPHTAKSRPTRRKG